MDGRLPSNRPAAGLVDERSSAAGLRAVATFEAVKGVIVLLLGFGLLTLLHKDAESVAEDLLIHLHVNPDRRLSHALPTRLHTSRIPACGASRAAPCHTL